MDAVWHFKDHNVRDLLFKRFMLADRDDMTLWLFMWLFMSIREGRKREASA